MTLVIWCSLPPFLAVLFPLTYIDHKTQSPRIMITICQENQSMIGRTPKLKAVVLSEGGVLGTAKDCSRTKKPKSRKKRKNLGHSIQKMFAKFGHSSEFRVFFLGKYREFSSEFAPWKCFIKNIIFRYGPSFFHLWIQKFGNPNAEKENVKKEMVPDCFLENNPSKKM